VNSRPFRFGVVMSTAASGKEWADSARAIEAQGFSSMCLTDHFDERLAPLTAAAFALAATSTLRVGTLVLGNDYRHPVVMAKEAATLDVLSDGRFELGLGAGWMRTDYDAAGMTYDAPGVRVSRMEEAAMVCRGLFSGEAFSFDGTHYKISGLKGTPVPSTSGGPKLLIGGGGQRVLSIAGRLANIVGINPTLTSGAIDGSTASTATAAAVDEKVAWVKAAAGDRFADIELNATLYLAQVTDDREGFATQMAPLFSLTPPEFLESPIVLCGTPEQMMQTLRDRRERWGISYITLQDDVREVLAPIVKEMTGS
jgi:probable F420-dependent oxidoreductase